MTTNKRGAFILFEGIDKCGKTTQSTLLVNALNKANIPSELIQFPNRKTPIGNLIDNYLTNKCTLHDRTIHLLFSANRWELFTEMIDKLNNGITLVVDRYTFSGISYTTAKNNTLFEWCKQPDIGLPQPDIVFLLDIPISKVALRSQYGTERYEKNDFQQKVRNIFSHFIDKKWVVLDANKSVIELHTAIYNKSLKIIAQIYNQHTQLVYI